MVTENITENRALNNPAQLAKLLIIKPWPNGPASSRKWTQIELA